MRDPLSEDQRRTGTYRRIGDAGTICGSAESDLLLHDFLTTRRNIFALDSACRNYAVQFAQPGGSTRGVQPDANAVAALAG